MRAFVGLPLPEPVITTLEAVQAELQIGRPVNPENLHLTLAFLDEQPEQTLAALHRELTDIEAPKPQIEITGLDVFGGRKPRLLFAAVANDPALTRLRNRVRLAARSVGIDLPHERFRPHITLARFPHRPERGQDEKLRAHLLHAGGFTVPGFDVGQFALYRSHLNPAGVSYEILAEYQLS